MIKKNSQSAVADDVTVRIHKLRKIYLMEKLIIVSKDYTIRRIKQNKNPHAHQQAIRFFRLLQLSIIFDEK